MKSRLGRTALIAMMVMSTVLARAHRAHAQAWVQPPSGYFFKIFASYLDTYEEFDFEGTRQPISVEDPAKKDARFQDFTIDAYLEYGLSKNWTLLANLPFKVLTASWTETGGPGFPDLDRSITNAGLADLTAGLRRQLAIKPVALSFEAGVKIPMGYEDQPDNDGPPLGSGKVDFLVGAFVGRSLWPLPGYISGGIGYRYRGGELHDDIPFNVEAGYRWRKLFGKVRLQGLKNTVEPQDLSGTTVMTPIPGGGGATPNNIIVGDQDWLKLMPNLVYVVSPRFQLSAEAFIVLAGKNTTAGTTYVFGLVFTR